MNKSLDIFNEIGIITAIILIIINNLCNKTENIIESAILPKTKLAIDPSIIPSVSTHVIN